MHELTVDAVAGEEREVALAEVDAVRAAARRGRLPRRCSTHGARRRSSRGGARPTARPSELDRIVEPRAADRPHPRAVRAERRAGRAAARTASCRAAASSQPSAKAVNEALASLEGRSLDQISIAAVGPGAFTISLVAGGAELSVRLDRQGARLASVGV